MIGRFYLHILAGLVWEIATLPSTAWQALQLTYSGITKMYYLKNYLRYLHVKLTGYGKHVGIISIPSLSQISLETTM